MVDVSVIIPVYNAQKHLEECVRSVCAQTLESIEIICVDDGSTDGSSEILARLAREDARVVAVRQENAGAGAARNRGVDFAKGKYLSFLDADDFFEPDMLKAAFDRAEEERSDLVVFKADFYDDKKGAYRPCIYGVREEFLPAHRPFAGTEIKKNAFKSVVGWAWDKLFRAEFVRENGLRFQEQRTTNDMLFVFLALARAQRISTLNRVLAHQRRNAGGTLSVTREKSWMCFFDALTALREGLKSWGLYERFERDYISYALHFSLWHLNTLKEPTKEMLFRRLKDEWFEELGVAGYPDQGVFCWEERFQYKMIMNMPYHRGIMRLAGVAQIGMTWLRRRTGR